MSSSNYRKSSLYEEADTAASSLVRQTAQVFCGLVLMLLLTQGSPSSFALTLSVSLGILFVARDELKRISIIEESEVIYQADFISRNFINTSLSNINLDSFDLAAADFHGVNLVNSSLVAANLTRADLSSADLTNANLSHSDLTNSFLQDASLIGANLSAANLTRANLQNADLSLSDLSYSNLSYANLGQANLFNANLTSTNLFCTEFSRARVQNARFTTNSGLSEDAERDLKKRGAIFEDPPNDIETSSNKPIGPNIDPSTMQPLQIPLKILEEDLEELE